VREEWYNRGKGLYVNWWQAEPQMIFLPWDLKTACVGFSLAAVVYIHRARRAPRAARWCLRRG
jgi:hypothetical protein